MRSGIRALTVSFSYCTRATACAALVWLFVCGRVIAQTPSPDRYVRYDRADIEAGSRLYDAQCAPCHGSNGDMIEGVDLRHGRFKTVITDDDLTRLLASGRPAAGMPAFKTFAQADMTAVIAFVRAGFDPDVTPGDPKRGQAIFSTKGECASCHRVAGRGPLVASDLSDIGSVRTAGSLRRALLDPAGSLTPANRTVRAVTKNGQTIQGRRLNEDTYTIQLLDNHERVVSLTKADLRSYEISKETTMPAYGGRLTADEIADVIAYLLSLKGVHP